MSATDERFSIGPDAEWCGLAKLSEEVGELQQVIGKLIATGGKTEHWDGAGPLDARLADELADVIAAAEFFAAANFDKDEIDARVEAKMQRFQAWRRGESIVVAAPAGSTGSGHD